MNSPNATSTKLDVYQIVTDRIIELLEKGTVPWRKPWTDAGMPMNLLSKRPYRGINLWLLTSLDYERNLFLTWDQVKKLGGSIKPGEHGHVVVFWKKKEEEAATEEEKQKKNATLLRYYKVFNISQCSDLPKDLVVEPKITEVDSVLECEAIIARMPNPPVIKHKENEAFYDMEGDFVNLPKIKSFNSADFYYNTLFHELVHSTGHEKRLNRPSISEMAEFGGDKYSMEELVAELGSAYLSHHAEILQTSIENNAAYISSWLKRLKNDKRLIVKAAGQAQRAVDFITKPEGSG